MLRKIFSAFLFLGIMLSLFISNFAEAAEAPLAQWEGKWTSQYAILDKPVMKGAYDAVVRKAPEGTTVEDVRTFMEAMWKTPFGNVTVNDDTIVYHSLDGKSIIASCVYKMAGEEKVSFGEHQFCWYKFEAVSGEGKVDDFRHLIATEIHSHGKGEIPHWHLRFGNESFDHLMNDKPAMWWPTLTSSKIPLKSKSAGIASCANAYASFMPTKSRETATVK